MVKKIWGFLPLSAPSHYESLVLKNVASYDQFQLLKKKSNIPQISKNEFNWPCEKQERNLDKI